MGIQNQMRDAGLYPIRLLTDKLALAIGDTTVSDGFNTAITAGTTQTQVGATALTARYNDVTVVGTANDGVRLPAGNPGLSIMVHNAAALPLKLYPATGAAINGGTADAAIILEPGATITCVSLSSLVWTTLLSSKKFFHANNAASTENVAITLTAYSNGTVVLPILKTGDVVRLRGLIEVTTLGSATSTNDTLQATVNLGGQVGVDTTAIADSILADYLYFDLSITQRVIHASAGTAYATGIISAVIGAVTLSGVPVNAALSSLANAAGMSAIIKGCFLNAANKTTLKALIVEVN